MEEETQTVTSSEIPVVKVVEDKDHDVHLRKATKGDMNHVEKEGKKEEEEHALDGEFIKVEKEALDVNDGGSHKVAVAVDKPSIIEQSSSNSSQSREVLEAHERVKELELELERVAEAFKRSESENTQLKDEVSITKEKLEESDKKHEELEFNLKKLQEASLAQEAKQNELISVKEAFDTLNIELESSRKRMQEMEQELHVSASKVLKFEELHKQSGSHAETETKRALELERMLELAKANAKEMDNQMASLQEEVKGLYEKIAENQKVEEELKITTADLSMVQVEFEASKSRMLDMEQRFASKEALINELTEELSLRTVSESKVKEDISTLENLLLSTKEDLQAKLSELDEIKLKLNEEVSAKKLVEEEVAKVTKEKETLDACVAELTGHLQQTKELCSDLEAKLQLSDENFCKADSLLSQALANSTELEQKLRSLEELHHESGYAVTTATKKNLELEEIVHASNVEAEAAKSLLGELETRCITAEQGKVEVEQQLNLVKLKNIEAERQFSEKISELDSTIGDLEELISTLEKKCGDVEEESKKHSRKVSELEAELEAFRSKATSLEVTLQTANEKEKELTECLNVTTVEKKSLEDTSRNSAEQLVKAENLLEVLRNELKLSQEQLESIESDLKAAGMRETEVMEKIKYAEGQLEEQERLLEQATARSSEFEKLHESLTRDSELKVQEAIANFSSRDIEAKSLFEKSKILEDQLKVYEKQLAEASDRSESVKEELDQNSVKLATLEIANEELKRKILEAEDRTAQSFSENELLVETNIQLKNKINELENALSSANAEKESSAQALASHVNTITDLTDKDSRASELHLKSETRISEAEKQLEEAIQKFTRRDLEAEGLQEKLHALEGQIRMYEGQASEAFALAENRKYELEQTLSKLSDLESIVEEVQSKCGHYEKEGNELAEVNLKLTQELATYESKLNDLQSEKDESVKELLSSKKAIEDLTQQFTSEGQRLQSQISSVMEENNLLNETYQNGKKELQTVIIQLEGQVKDHESNEVALKDEMEILKAQIGEKSVLKNRVKELEEQLVIAETRVKEEVESIQEAALGREAELTSNLEDHVHQARDRDLLNEQVLQLQLELHEAQTSLIEKKEADSRKELERDVILKSSLEELEAKNKSLLLLETQVKELQQKFQPSDAKSKEKDGGEIPSEVKSRDVGSTISTPSKRRSKRKVEAASQTSSSSDTPIQTTDTDASLAMSFKFILGIALISVIIGIVLGKRY